VLVGGFKLWTLDHGEIRDIYKKSKQKSAAKFKLEELEFITATK